MDRVMLFGFLSSFFTLVLLGYRNQLTTRLPVIPLSLTCCAAYGFLQGVWPLGFCLIAVTVEEFAKWRQAVHVPPIQTRPIFFPDRPLPLPECQSRISRMFGSN